MNERALFVEHGLERGPRVKAFDIGGKLWPAFGIKLLAGVVEVHEHRSDRDIRNRKGRADEIILAADLMLQMIEKRRKLFGQRFLTVAGNNGLRIYTNASHGVVVAVSFVITVN